ncbi:MAG: aspartyl protease [Chloroflexi bacterium]|nr:aspartyl protease [Chloroflexota bacterium]
MGLTFVKVKFWNPSHPEIFMEREFLVDSGAVYSLVPKPLLAELGIVPYTKKHFMVADGRSIERDLGWAFFSVDGEASPSPVIFGEPNDQFLLGVVTLESVGLMIDPINGKLKPLPMLLMAVSTR